MISSIGSVVVVSYKPLSEKEYVQCIVHLGGHDAANRYGDHQRRSRSPEAVWGIGNGSFVG
jgi:hypothetical protein